MTRFNRDLLGRVERDLGQIADHATPSSTTAWEAIRQRIDDQTDEPTMEVIMLAPNDHDPSRRNRTWLLIAASVAAIALVGGLIVAASRTGDDNAPADRPTVPSTPTSDPGETGETDGELTVDPNAEQETGAAPPPTILADDTLPPVSLQTTGTWTGTCAFGNFLMNDDGSLTAPQTCSQEGDPLPAPAQDRISLTLFVNDDELQNEPFLSVSDSGTISAGYNYPPNGGAYFVGLAPGVGDYDGEQVHFLGHSPFSSGTRSDWTIDPDDAPLPSTADEVGISAEVAVSCTPTGGGLEGIALVLEQACTFDGDDPRFVPDDTVFRTRLISPDGEPYADQRPAFVIGEGDDRYVVGGIAEDFVVIRAVGHRSGSGEFEGMEIHDVIHFESDPEGNLTGTMRSTVYPDR